MQDVRNSCLSVDECDTPDEVRQQFDILFGHIRELQSEIEALKSRPGPVPTEEPARTRQKGGK